MQAVQRDDGSSVRSLLESGAVDPDAHGAFSLRKSPAANPLSARSVSNQPACKTSFSASSRPPPARKPVALSPQSHADPITGLAPLHVAVHEAAEAALEALLEAGADPDIRTLFTRETPAAIAASEGHWEVLQHLVQDWGASTFWMDSAGLGPIHAAAKAGHLAVVKCLVEELAVDPDVRCASIFVPRWACDGGPEVARVWAWDVNVITMLTYCFLPSPPEPPCATLPQNHRRPSDRFRRA